MKHRLKRLVMRPGPGWRCLSSAVYEHESGARIHTGGLVRLPSGDHFHLFNFSESEGMWEAIKINGMNLKRGLMAWAASQVNA